MEVGTEIPPVKTGELDTGNDESIESRDSIKSKGHIAGSGLVRSALSSAIL